MNDQQPLAPPGSLVERYDYSRLSHLQLGRYAEYLAKMEFTLYGFDVYSAEVDQHGIDFVLRSQACSYLDIQVKSLRKGNYVYFPKTDFVPRASLLAVLVLFKRGSPPGLYLIPSTVWRDRLGGPFVDRPYEGRKSAPEWGLSVNKTHTPALDEFRFERTIQTFLEID